MVFSSPVVLHSRALLMAPLMVWQNSGAVTMPSVLAKVMLASKISIWS